MIKYLNERRNGKVLGFGPAFDGICLDRSGHLGNQRARPKTLMAAHTNLAKQAQKTVGLNKAQGQKCETSSGVTPIAFVDNHCVSPSKSVGCHD